MNRSILVLMLVLAAACGVAASPTGPTTPIADPIPMLETQAAPAPADEPVVTPEPTVAVDPAPVEPVVAAEPVGAVAPAVPPPVLVKPVAARPPKAKPAAPTRIEIVVTQAGFEPKNVDVPRGKPVLLRFERKVDRTCGTEVVMVVDGKRIEKELPLDTPVELALTFGTAGIVKYSCAMDMIRGTITVK